jgi:hypothetical protein
VILEHGVGFVGMVERQAILKARTTART